MHPDISIVMGIMTMITIAVIGMLRPMNQGLAPAGGAFMVFMIIIVVIMVIVATEQLAHDRLHPLRKRRQSITKVIANGGTMLRIVEDRR